MASKHIKFHLSIPLPSLQFWLRILSLPKATCCYVHKHPSALFIDSSTIFALAQGVHAGMTNLQKLGFQFFANLSCPHAHLTHSRNSQSICQRPASLVSGPVKRSILRAYASAGPACGQGKPAKIVELQFLTEI